MEELFDAIKIKENCYKGNHNGEIAFIIKDYFEEEINLKYLSIKKVTIENKISSLFILKNDKFIDVLEFFIKIDFLKISFNKFLDFFSKTKPKSLLKLRGDFGEVYFLKKFGGKKLSNEQKFDIFHNEKYYEIKTFSKSNGKITIKNSQINQTIDIICLELEYDNEGKTILDLAYEINDLNFREYLLNKYKKTNIGKLKFKVIDFWKIFPQKLIFNDNSILDANIFFSFNKIEKEKIDKL